jgi:hypothetical protein
MTPGFYRRRWPHIDGPYLSAGIRVDRVFSAGAGVAHVAGHMLHRTATGWATGGFMDRLFFVDAFEPMDPPR